MKKWTIDDSKELYNINGWGTSYFGINDEGNVYVTPCKDGTQIDLREVMDELSLRDVQSPVLLRFPDILDNRIEKTWSCFKKAAEEYEYKGENYVVFPIKVNQMQPVVEEIISHGRKFNLGIEAGSFPTDVSSIWALRLVPSPNCTLSLPFSVRATPSSSVMAIRISHISNWPCWHRRWASVSSSSLKS